MKLVGMSVVETHREDHLSHNDDPEGLEGSLRADAQPSQKSATQGSRAGDDCSGEQGMVVPVVNRSRCEGKSDCVRVCPYNVFEVRAIDDTDYKGLPLVTKLKLWVHGKKTAYTPRADACLACGLCVAACPERAITLARRRTAI